MKFITDKDITFFDPNARISDDIIISEEVEVTFFDPNAKISDDIVINEEVKA